MKLIKHLFGASLVVLVSGTAFADELSNQNPLSFAQSCQSLLTTLSPQIQVVLNSIVENIQAAQLDTTVVPGGGTSGVTNFTAPIFNAVIANDGSTGNVGAVAKIGWDSDDAILALQFNTAEYADNNGNANSKLGTCGPLGNAYWEAQAKVVPLVSLDGTTVAHMQDAYWYFSPTSGTTTGSTTSYTPASTDARNTFGRGFTTPVAFDYGFIAPLSPFASVPIQMNLFAPMDAPWFANAATVSKAATSFPGAPHLLPYSTISTSTNFMDSSNTAINWNAIDR